MVCRRRDVAWDHGRNERIKLQISLGLTLVGNIRVVRSFVGRGQRVVLRWLDMTNRPDCRLINRDEDGEKSHRSDHNYLTECGRETHVSSFSAPPAALQQGTGYPAAPAADQRYHCVTVRPGGAPIRSQLLTHTDFILKHTMIKRE